MMGLAELKKIYTVLPKIPENYFFNKLFFRKKDVIIENNT